MPQDSLWGRNKTVRQERETDAASKFSFHRKYDVEDESAISIH